MTCFVMFFFMVVVFLALVVIGVWNRTRAGRHHIYQRLSHRYHGVYLASGWTGWFHEPRLSFRHGLHLVRLTTRASNRNFPAGQTKLSVKWPDEHFQLELWPRNRGGRKKSGKVCDAVVPQAGTHHVPPEWVRSLPNIGHAFSLTTNDNDATKHFLNAGVCAEIEKFSQLYTDNFSLQVANGTLVICCHWQLNEFEKLEQLTEVSLDLVDQAFLTRCEGIQFVQQEGTELHVTACCQVCGEDIVVDLVSCRRCKTPHHVECWQYNGCCTTYGCQETSYVSGPDLPQQGTEQVGLKEEP